MILYLDNENDQNRDGFKRALGSVLVKAYQNVSIAELKHDAYTAYGVSEAIKRHKGIIVIWNSLKPFCTWSVDLCQRFNKDYVLVERGLVPSQGVDNFCFLAGGLCFDNLNIDPKYFDPNTYEKNKEIIDSHYKEKNLQRIEPKDKIVFIGQVPWDSTVTHFHSVTDQIQIIDNYISDNQIDVNKTKIVYCPHPRMREAFKECKYPVSNQETINECLDAKLVVAVSSTTIYEIAGLGIPVDILGKGKYLFPTQRNWNNIKECLSTALDFHFNTSTDSDQIKEIIDRTVSITNDIQE
jgi:hypothetical protein